MDRRRQLLNTADRITPNDFNNNAYACINNTRHACVTWPDRERRRGGGFPFLFRRGSGCSIEMPAGGGHRRERDQSRVAAPHCRAGRADCRGELGYCG